MLDRVSMTIQKYNQSADEYAKGIAMRLPKKELDIFIKLLPKSAKVIEIGSAGGRDTHYLHENGMEVTGIDLSEELTKIARKYNPEVTFQICDMRKLTFEGSSFDGIWASAVFHHLDRVDMLPTLQEWSRVLRPNGIIYLSTKMGKGNWHGKDALSVGQEREFTLLMPEELGEMFNIVNFKKISLITEKDSTRDIYWIRAFYRKYG